MAGERFTPRHNLAVFPHAERRAVHARSLLRIFRRAAQGTPDSSGKAQRPAWLGSRFSLHGLFSNNRGARPELSYTAQLSASAAQVAALNVQKTREG
jgi:hypothetical protein